MFSHNVKTMLALPHATLELFNALPTEFTKKEFDATRNAMSNAHPLSLAACRDYNFVVVVRREPITYKTRTDVWTNPTTGEQYTADEIVRKWSIELAEQFGVPSKSNFYFSPYCRLPYERKEIEREGFRNIFAVDFEKFQEFLQKNS